MNSLFGQVNRQTVRFIGYDILKLYDDSGALYICFIEVEISKCGPEPAVCRTSSRDRSAGFL